jgi:hypothetical protein
MANPGIAIPGSVVAIGSQASPAGAQGIQGPTAVSADAGNIATLGSDSLVLVPQSTLWYQRLRSFNAIGNPNFEVDQRLAGGGTSTQGAFGCDRWVRAGNLAYSLIQLVPTGSTPNVIVIPGTNFPITSKIVRVTLTTQKTSLAATDFLAIQQNVEGAVLRELISDVHSISILCRASAATNCCVSLRDSANAYSLALLSATVPGTNVWTVISFPNIPVWSTSGNFPITPGNQGYTLGICLAAGTTYQAPTPGIWTSGNYPGLAGMSNFAANAAGATFDLAFVQHEPGSQCSTFQDKPFFQNYDECLRYWCKSYDYATAIGTVTANGALHTSAIASQNPHLPVRFPKTMAKVPAIAGYSDINGAAGVNDSTASTGRAITGVFAAGQTGFSGFTLGTVNASAAIYTFHYVADTGW